MVRKLDASILRQITRGVPSQMAGFGLVVGTARKGGIATLKTLCGNGRARLQFTLRNEGSCRKYSKINPASAAGGRFCGLPHGL